VVDSLPPSVKPCHFPFSRSTIKYGDELAMNFGANA
jgi:hypothetical protein